MKLTNIKLKVETDEENQYVLHKHIELNEGFAWVVNLVNGYIYWDGQPNDYYRANGSVWKGFRHLTINSDGDLILFAFEKNYSGRTEKEITFAEFKNMCEPEDVIELNGVKYTRVSDDED